MTRTVRHALLVNPRQSDLARATSSKCLTETCKMMGRAAATPPLGLLTVAGLLPAEWTVTVVDLNVRPLTEDDWAVADIVMTTGFSDQTDSQREVLAEAKRRGKLTVAGGGWASAAPEGIRAAGADFVVVDEAETAMPRLLEMIARGEPGGIVRGEGSADVSTSPVPRFDLLDMTQYAMATVQFSRGCPFRCEFCDIINKGIGGRVMRHKSPAQFVAELEALRRSGWRGTVFIADDNFIGDRKRTRELLPEVARWMKRNGRPFTLMSEASINIALDQPLMAQLVDAGITRLFIGIESVDHKALEITKKRQNMGLPILEACRRLAAAGIEVHGAFILGFDGETRGAGERLLALVEDAPMTNCDLNFLWALPQSALWKRLKSEGRLRLNPDGSWESNRMNFEPSRPMEEIFDETMRFYALAFDPANILERCAGQQRLLAQARGRRQSRPSLGEMRAFLHVAWRYGVLRRCRLRFWRHVVGLAPHGPRILWSFLRMLAHGETNVSLTRVTLPAWQAALQEMTAQAVPPAAPAPLVRQPEEVVL